MPSSNIICTTIPRRTNNLIADNHTLAELQWKISIIDVVTRLVIFAENNDKYVCLKRKIIKKVFEDTVLVSTSTLVF